jgi:hypothetical protein
MTRQTREKTDLEPVLRPSNPSLSRVREESFRSRRHPTIIVDHNVNHWPAAVLKPGVVTVFEEMVSLFFPVLLFLFCAVASPS